jgi:hypothetical protein
MVLPIALMVAVVEAVTFLVCLQLPQVGTHGMAAAVEVLRVTQPHITQELADSTEAEKHQQSPLHHLPVAPLVVAAEQLSMVLAHTHPVLALVANAVSGE